MDTFKKEQDKLKVRGEELKTQATFITKQAELQIKGANINLRLLKENNGTETRVEEKMLALNASIEEFKAIGKYEDDERAFKSAEAKEGKDQASMEERRKKLEMAQKQEDEASQKLIAAKTNPDLESDEK